MACPPNFAFQSQRERDNNTWHFECLYKLISLAFHKQSNRIAPIIQLTNSLPNRLSSYHDNLIWGKQRERERETHQGATNRNKSHRVTNKSHLSRNPRPRPQVAHKLLTTRWRWGNEKEIALVLIWFMFDKDFLQTHNPTKIGLIVRNG